MQPNEKMKRIFLSLRTLRIVTIKDPGSIPYLLNLTMFQGTKKGDYFYWLFLYNLFLSYSFPSSNSSHIFLSLYPSNFNVLISQGKKMKAINREVTQTQKDKHSLYSQKSRYTHKTKDNQPTVHNPRKDRKQEEP